MMAAKKLRLIGLAFALCAAAWQGTASAQPLDLLSTLQLAVQQDPQYRADQAAAEAG
ncbi:MAG: hypothetical protein M0Q29_04480 [Thiopseudomonas sp.]|nr:hypothetical protein [Thiopseudomonas sp.]MCK9465122.1 hypothetical protein [Thiopseudomonas sp.]